MRHEGHLHPRSHHEEGGRTVAAVCSIEHCGRSPCLVVVVLVLVPTPVPGPDDGSGGDCSPRQVGGPVARVEEVDVVARGQGREARLAS